MKLTEENRSKDKGLLLSCHAGTEGAENRVLLDARCVWVDATAQPLCSWGSDPIATAQTVAWAAEPGWTRWRRPLATNRFEHRTFQPVPSRYINCAIPPLLSTENRNTGRSSGPSATVHRNSQTAWPESQRGHRPQRKAGK